MPCRTLTEIFEAAGLSRVHFFSLDVEDFVHQALASLDLDRVDVDGLAGGPRPAKYGRLPHVVLDRRHPRAPERRWWLLMLLALVPFGGHFFKNALSALQPFLPLSATQYGALHSTFALPNATIAPMLGGLLYDSAQLRRWATPIFALLAFCGGVLCVGGLGLDDLALTYAGGVTLGLGQGCVVVACRAIASTFSHAAFAQGLSLIHI